MTSTRRDLIKFGGGAAVGALLTPAPWRLVTDTALWSETWPGVPRVARGEIRARYTNCSLCPAGCPVRARCLGDQPVALFGVADHPFSHGALCPFGLAGHHLPYHPQRLKQGPVEQAKAAVADAIARCGAEERIAILDLRPGRTASWTYRRAAKQWKSGTYLAPHRILGGDVAVNLAAAKNVISVGAPLFDGWGTPGNVIAARDKFRLIQIEATESRTASLADTWVPVQPGDELQTARKFAQDLAAQGPTLVLDAGERSEILALNQTTGALGTAIVSRREAPVPDSWNEAAPESHIDALPDRSIRVLLIDESAAGSYIPWSRIEKKLVADNPLVVVFGSSADGYGRHAGFVLPTAVYPEAVDDIPPAVDSPVAMFRLSTSLVAAPAGLVNPAQFIAGFAGIDAANSLRERADAIHKAGRGKLFTYADAKSTPLKDVKADDFWKALNDGASWTDEAPVRPAAPILALVASTANATEDDLPLAVLMAEAQPTPGSPILTKLYQESNLRLAANRIALHPSAAKSCGIADGGRAMLQTRCGKLEVQVTLDEGLPPGVVRVPAVPCTFDLCGTSPRAKVVRI
jgi:hypothetical protein